MEGAYGGSNRFSSFVSLNGKPDEDPKPRAVRNDTHGGEEHYTNRLTGQAAWETLYVTIRRLDVNEGQAYAALTLEHSGHNPETDITFAKPISGSGNYCPNCGFAL